jgi:hypothetical protein
MSSLEIVNRGEDMFDDFVRDKDKRSGRRRGSCNKCGRVNVPMATKTSCETCYGQTRAGRSGRTKDQNVLIKCFNTEVRNLRTIGLSDAQITQQMQPLLSYFESIQQYLTDEAQTQRTLVRAIFGKVDALPNPSTESAVDNAEGLSTSNPESAVDVDQSASTAKADSKGEPASIPPEDEWV